MIRVYCKTGDPTSGRTTVTFDREEGVTIVIRNVPARICPQCGEQYFDADATDRLLAALQPDSSPRAWRDRT